MENAQQTPENKPALVEFYNEEAKTAWLAGRSLNSLERWQLACFECNLVPPATREEFVAAEESRPEIEAWRRKNNRERFRAGAKEQLEKKGVPAEMIEILLDRLMAEAGPKVELSDHAQVKVLRAGQVGELADLGKIEEMMGDDDAPAEDVIEDIKKLIEVEKSAEREKCARLIEALDPVAGKRFAEAIRFRDREEKVRAQCDCAKCTAKRMTDEALSTAAQKNT